jgi:iron complex transport system substrate-binding protein
MTGHPLPRRTSARPTLPHRRQRRTALLPVALVLVLALVLGAGLLVAGCGGTEATTTTAASPATTAASTATTTGAATTGSTGATTGGSATTAAPAQTTTSAAAQTSAGTFPVTVTDDDGTKVAIKSKPARIVSTKPASTEILFAIGAGDRVVGVSSLDDYPPEAANIAKVGDFEPNTEAVMGLSPDLVISYSGYEEKLDPVAAEGAAVVTLNPASVDGIYADITMLGAATGNTEQAAALVDSIKTQIKKLSDAATATGSAPKVFYAVDNTLWTVGPGTFVDDLLKLANAVNIGSMPGSDGAGVQQYYQFAPEQLIAADPDVILLPNTAYKTVDEFTSDPRFAQLSAVKDKQVFLIDDVIVTRPGPRISTGLEDLVRAIHPDAAL